MNRNKLFFQLVNIFLTFALFMLPKEGYYSNFFWPAFIMNLLCIYQILKDQKVEPKKMLLPTILICILAAIGFVYYQF